MNTRLSPEQIFAFMSPHSCMLYQHVGWSNDGTASSTLYFSLHHGNNQIDVNQLNERQPRSMQNFNVMRRLL